MGKIIYNKVNDKVIIFKLNRSYSIIIRKTGARRRISKVFKNILRFK